MLNPGYLILRNSSALTLLICLIGCPLALPKSSLCVQHLFNLVGQGDQELLKAGPRRFAPGFFVLKFCSIELLTATTRGVSHDTCRMALCSTSPLEKKYPV